MFSPFICWFVLFVMSSVIPEVTYAQFRQDVLMQEDYHYLNVPKLGTYTAYDTFECTLKCLRNPSCFSVNLAASKGADGKLWCELLSSEMYSNREEYKRNKTSHHLNSIQKTPCVSPPCQNGGTCVPNNKNRSFDCHCREGFIGEFCEIAAPQQEAPSPEVAAAAAPGPSVAPQHEAPSPEVAAAAAPEPSAAPEQEAFSPEVAAATAPEPSAAKSCQDVYDHATKQFNVSQVVTLILDSKPTSVLCHMKDFGCGDGGWTPVMKMDGNKQNFHYSSPLWSNKETLNLDGGETGFDSLETKLPSYWSTPFSKICLGIKIGQQIKFININKQADSLFSLIADGQYRATSLGRKHWKSLIGSEVSLQQQCNKEGFNAMCNDVASSKARIGILGNNQNNCGTCDSRIGFGTGGENDDSNTCGNESTAHDKRGGHKHIKAMGYIFVQ